MPWGSYRHFHDVSNYIIKVPTINSLVLVSFGHQALPRLHSLNKTGVTTSRATSGGWRKDRNTSGQRRNKFSNSYRDISVIVAENNSVVKLKYQQYTSLNKMLSNFSKVLMAHISFTAVINNRGIGGIRKGTKKNYIYVL